MGPTPAARVLAALGLLVALAAALLVRARGRPAATRATRRWLAALVEHAESPMVLIDCERRIRWANPAFDRLTGRGARELEGSVIAVFEAARADPALLRAARDEMRLGHGFALESWLPAADGADRWVHVNCQPVRRPRGAVEAWVAILTDLTGRRHAEADLFGRVRRLEAAAAAGGVGLWQLEPGGEVWLDATARRLLGLPAGRDRIPTAALTAGSLPDDRSGGAAGLANALQLGGGVDQRLASPGPDGARRALRLVGRASPGGDGRIEASGVLYEEPPSLHPTVNTG